MKRNTENNKIKVIDLFAGPGGLSEGFVSFSDKRTEEFPFKISLSIEKDINAHKTLELRSFFRQFPKSKAPEDYYRYLQGRISRDELFDKYSIQAKLASSETWCAELGVISHDIVTKRIKKCLKGTKKWILIGGPPCQAYSLVGRARMRNGSSEKFEKDHRHFLYKEYLKIILEHKPPVFVMENVKGIISSKINGSSIFEKILKDLRSPAEAFSNSKISKSANQNLQYDIFSFVKENNNFSFNEKRDFVVKFEEYGIPQRRHRVILMGIRSDLTVNPKLLIKYSKEIKMWDVLSDLPKLRSGVSGGVDSFDKWKAAINRIQRYKWFSKNVISNIFIKFLEKHLSKIRPKRKGLGSEYIPTNRYPKYWSRWYHDSLLKGVCNHVAKRHFEKDLQRYFYASCFAKKHSRSPQIRNFPRVLWPKHQNIKEAGSGKMFADRFRVQVRNKPSTTITSHLSKDGHYYIHPDPVQCRSLTVREAARLQTFPDNYFFEGSKTSQYHQVGNAVPPLLAKQIAGIVHDVFEQIK